MAKQKEKTVEELLRKTKKLVEPRPSCVLEGKASMRGPGVKDPSDDAESRKFCTACGRHVDEGDLSMCSICDRGCHSSCLQPPINATLGVDRLCPQCLGSCSHLASEPSLDSSCGVSELKAMTCILDSKLDGQHDLRKGEILLSGSQGTPREGSKSVAVLKDDLKTFDQSERGLIDVMEGAMHSGLEDTTKLSQGSGESGSRESSELALTLEHVRRSKRGRPYTPVGGLHPIKRRNVEDSSRYTNRVPQGRLRPVIDEEDELGAKIEKFRVISSIDDSSGRKETPNGEDSKRNTTGSPSLWDEEEVGELANTSVEADKEDKEQANTDEKTRTTGSSPSSLAMDHVVDSKVAADGSNLEGGITTVVSGELKLDSLSAGRGGFVKETVLKLREEPPDGPFSGSLLPVILQRDVDERHGNELPILGGQTERQQSLRVDMMGSEHAQKHSKGQVRVESPTVSPAHMLVSSKDGCNSAKGSVVPNFGTSMMGKMHPLSSCTKSETSGNIVVLRDTCNAVDTLVTSKRLMEKAEESISMQAPTPVASNEVSHPTDDNQKGFSLVQPVLSESNVVTLPCSSSATNLDSDNHPSQSPTSVLHGKGRPEDIPPIVEASPQFPAVLSGIQGTGGSVFLSDVSKDTIANTHLAGTTVFPTQDADVISLGTSQAVVKGTIECSPVSTLPTMSNDGKCDLTSIGPLELVRKNVKSSSSCMQSETDVTAGPLERSRNPAVTDGLFLLSSLPCDDVKVNISQSVSPSLTELTHTGETGHGFVHFPVASTATSASVPLGRNSDDCTGIMHTGAISSSSDEEELALRGLRSGSLEEEDEVKVCDICGDAGYEECLAVCSACNEGAEHIYCMQALLHAVPDDGWLCEGCKSQDKAGNWKQVKDIPVNHVTSGSVYLSLKTKQIIKGNTRSRLAARLDKGKGACQRKGATKGSPNHQLSTKRPADDPGSAPLAKRQAGESPSISLTATSTLASRVLSRENSSKTPDSGKVKFLSPNALASVPVGGGNRNSGKTLGFGGLLSHSPRPVSTQLTQAASRNRYATSKAGSTDSASGMASVATKQPPLTPKQPPLYVTAPSTAGGAGRVPGSVKSSESPPSFLLPSRLGHTAVAKGSKERISEGNGLLPVGRNANTAGQLAGGAIGKGWNSSSSGKLGAKWIDTPRPTSQSPGLTRQCYPLKIDSAVSSQPFDSTGMPGKPIVFQNRVQMLDVAKNLNSLGRLPSFSRLSSSQSSRDEAQCSLELQTSKVCQQDLKPLDSSAPMTPSVTSTLNLQTILDKLSSEVSNPEQRGSQDVMGFEDASKRQTLDPPGPVIENEQRKLFGAPHDEILASEDVKKPFKASTKAPPIKESVLDEIANVIPNESTISEKDFMWKDTPGVCWSSSAHMTSMLGTRCYKCKEIGHSAQACSTRGTASTSLTSLFTSNTDALDAINSPKGGLGGSSSTLWGPRSSDRSSLGEQKHSPGCSSIPLSTYPVQEIKPEGSVPVSGKSIDIRQGPNKRTLIGSPEGTPTNLVEDTRKQLPRSCLPSQGRTVGRICSQNGQPTAFTSCEDLQPPTVGKANVSLDAETSILADASNRKLPVPVCVNQSWHPEGYPGGESTSSGALTEAWRSDSGPVTVQEIPPWLSNEQTQTCCRKMNMLAGPGLPPLASFNCPLAPPLPTPMMIQAKGLGPWGHFAPPRPMPGVDRTFSQDAKGLRGGVMGPGIGASASHGFGSLSLPAEPESQFLWRGAFEVFSAAVPASYDGLQAYSSSFAAPKVRAVTKTLPPILHLEEVQRECNADAWPKQFQQKPPTDKEIALYFFPDSERFEPGYMRLLKNMMDHDLVLMGQVEGAEMLIFPSHLLHVDYHRWKNKMFLWGVYRARKTNPVIAAAPDSGQTSALVHSSAKVMVADQPGKLVRPGTPVIASNGDAGEVDMEIDMIGDKELAVPDKPIQKSVWNGPCLTSPPLPQEPPPVQPPPPAQPAIFQEEGLAAGQDTSSMEVSSKDSKLADMDLPPGFGPVPQKQVLQSGPSGFGSTLDGPPGFEPAACCPPGFEKLRKGGGAIETPGNTEDASIVDGDYRESTLDRLASRQEGSIAEHALPATKPRQTTKYQQRSPLLAPSPSPRDLPDDSVVGTSHTLSARLSYSSSQSPTKCGDGMRDQSSGKASFYTRESERDRERRKDRERDRDTWREKDKKRRRERGRDRERGKDREKERDRSYARDRDKHRHYRQGDRERHRDHRYRRHARSRSQSESRSRSFSASRWRLQSPSVSPTGQRNSGKCRSRHRSRSYSDSPDSCNHGRAWRKRASTERQVSSRDWSQDGVGTERRVTSRLDDINQERFSQRDVPHIKASHKSRLAVHSGKEEFVVTKDVTRKGGALTGDDRPGNASSIPFYDIHHEAETRSQNFPKGSNNRDNAPHYHLFLQGESGDADPLETDIGDDVSKQLLFTKNGLSPGAGASNVDDLSEQPQLGTLQNPRSWELDKTVECSAYQFFPVQAGNAGDLRESSRKHVLPLGLGEQDGRNLKQSDPFFVQLDDTAGSSPEPCHTYTDSMEASGLTVEFPLVTEMKEEPGKAEVGSLNLTLSVPQYRKEGNVWVKIKDTETALGEEDLDFALTL